MYKRQEETRTSLKGATGTQLVRYAGELNGATVELEDLTGCTVLLLDTSSQVTIDRCVDCVFLFGPVGGSVFLRDSVRCALSAPCRQLRTRACADCDLFVHTLGPIVETSTRVRFARYNLSYPGQPAHFAKAKLDPAMSNWADVYDFSKADDAVPQPHWELLADGDFARMEVRFDGAAAAKRFGNEPACNAAAELLPPALAAAPARVLPLSPPGASPFAERQPIGKRLVDGKWMLIYDEDDMAAKPAK